MKAADLTADQLSTPTGKRLVLQAINQVELSMGLELSEERRAAIALAVAGAGFTEAQVLLAAKALCLDVELDAKLRFGYTLTAADFRRVIEGDGEAAKARLYSYPAMLERFGKLGGGKEGGPSMSDLFDVLDTPDGKRWRER